VITIANAGGYTTAACNIIGAVPVYVDVKFEGLLLDFKGVVEALTSKTRCIVVTHLYGQPVDVMALRRILQKTGYEHVAVLEDCAQAHGAKVNDCMVGSMGDLATFSFYPTKNLSALGDGGAIVTRSEKMANDCRKLSQYGWNRKYESVVSFGRNSRMDEIQAAILRVKLNHLDEFNRKRCYVADCLNQMTNGRLDVVTRPVDGYVAHLFVVRHPDRDSVRNILAEHGVMTDVHYPILDPDQISMRTQQYRVTSLDVTRQAASEVFSLPCYACLHEEELDYMQSVFDSFVAKAV